MLLSPYVIVFLAALLSLKWGLLSYRYHRLQDVFSCLSYVYFSVMFLYISYVDPNVSDFRVYVRLGLAVLFLNLNANWLIPLFSKKIGWAQPNE